MASSFDPDGEIVKSGVPNIREKVGRRRFMKGAGTATVAASMGLAGCSNPAKQGGGSAGGGEIPSEPLRMACIGFTSGPASVFGTPMMQSARMVVDRINQEGGILGEREIEMEEFDENVDEIVQQYRRLATQEDFDVIVGYISSANVLSIAPIAEELGQPTVVWDTGTTDLFDKANKDPQYVFRTCASSSTDAIGAARLLQTALTDVETVAGVNQDYAFGRNNWDLFTQAIESLGIDVEIVDSRFTPFPNDDYSSTISALNSTNPDFIYSSHWGGDAVNFITQANSQGLFDDTLPCFTAGSHVIGNIPDEIPEGIIFGARGPHYPFGTQQWNSLHEQFVENYQSEYGEPPYAHGAFHAWQAIWAYVYSIERAYNLSGQYPTKDQWVKSMEGIGFNSPSGFVNMPQGSHNVVEPSFYGFSDPQEDRVDLRDTVWIAPEHVNPPPSMTTSEWISSL
ncbi:ABC transporter substrate-binding protein [Natrinema caseinilyticum]|uniref:ABC transporter substrate-binding protein n=1 Tax=Natrinema caseinilyticum TaxID=2961570 RepID=UPI0021154E92|nr:ABC transporter substrate-binding protein [Natrinema caseinilyticum]